MTLLEISGWTGVLAVTLLAFRLFSTWSWTGPLLKGAVIVLLATLIGQVYGTTQTIQNSVMLTDGTVRVVFATRLLAVTFALLGPWRR